MLGDPFNLHGVHATTMGATPVILVSGPARREAGLNMEHGALGSGEGAGGGTGGATGGDGGGGLGDGGGGGAGGGAWASSVYVSNGVWRLHRVSSIDDRSQQRELIVLIELIVPIVIALHPSRRSHRC